MSPKGVQFIFDKVLKGRKNHELLKVKGPKLFWIVVGMEGYQSQCESNSPT